MIEKVPLKLSSLQEPGTRYELVADGVLGAGVCGRVHLAVDTQAGGKKVAIKIQKVTNDTTRFIQEEYRVLRDYSEHPNLPDFYGVYLKKGEPYDEVWFVMEYCEGGAVSDLISGLQANNRRMSEDHIAFILREVIKALIHLHENNIIHRDVRASNILLSASGDVKLVDFGFCQPLNGQLGKCKVCIGSPSWMAPELVTCEHAENASTGGYGNRVDVWSVGILAIELGDGKAPFIDMNPTRALFQIVRNPPPGLYRPTNWTQIYNDFIHECLEKNPDHRPFMIELTEHPFFENIPDNDYYLNQELKQLAAEFSTKNARNPECVIMQNQLWLDMEKEPEKLYVEDLAALESLTEDKILSVLQERTKQGKFHTYVGDVLLILNPNEKPDIYNTDFHVKYKSKSRSDNAPHIYTVADSAYQDALHHDEPQHIIFSGETLSGKTAAMLHAIEHLTFLGSSSTCKNGVQVLRALTNIHAFSNASTPTNPNSTRCINRIQVTFGSTGKISGAIFSVIQLEKWRVSSTDMAQANFHIFYYLYDALDAENKLSEFQLEKGRKYRYLRIPESKLKCGLRPRDNPKQNFKQFLTIQQNFLDLGFDENQIETIWKILASILHLGDVQFRDTEDGFAEVDNVEVATKVAQLLNIDEKKFLWALTNYCSIRQGTAIRKKHRSDEARDARDILAGNIYSRLVDWVNNIINYKLAVGRAVFGDKFMINLLDMFGFECHQRNNLEQLFVNCFNEQMQYHYTQRVFAWEMLEYQEEQVSAAPLTYFDNRSTIDELLGKPSGLLSHLDDASKNYYPGQYIIESVKKIGKTPHIKFMNSNEFAVAHYTGTVTYNVKEMADRNRDFLPPEMIDVLRLSKNTIIRLFFSNSLNKTGNLQLEEEQSVMANTTRKARWSAALMKETQKIKKVNFSLEHMNYSQTKRMRTAASVFRAASLEVLRLLSIGPGNGGTHFVRCIRTDLLGAPRGFQPEVVRQQLRALAVLDTAKARLKGFPHRIPFSEFIRRYKFLAFDFDENVDITKDNCRLLLVRLKMEGYVFGHSKVFLKYYNEEYLARLYETQVKKIVHVQCMMRKFLAKRNVLSKLKQQSKSSPSVSKPEPPKVSSADDKASAALMIQKTYRGYVTRKKYGPLINKITGYIDEDTSSFIRPFAQKWKSKTIFQVIVKYRAARHQDIVYFSQQVHIYNQNVMTYLDSTKGNIGLEKINPKSNIIEFLGEKKPSVWKLPFRIDEIPFYDSSSMCDPYSSRGFTVDEEQEAWDSPLQWRQTNANHSTNDSSRTKPSSGHHASQKSTPIVINTPFCRDPSVPLNQITPIVTKEEEPINTFTKTLRSVEKTPPRNIDFDEAPAAPKFYNQQRLRTVNPIKELESLGRKNATDDTNNEDAPPFNFQSMLRKTNYNRESMKRDDNRLISEYKPKTAPRKIYMSNDSDEFIEPEKKTHNVVFQTTRKSKSPDLANGTSGGISTFELVPGVTIEGQVADL